MHASIHALAAAAVLALAAPAGAHTVVYTAVLNGASESSPNASLGTGTATVTIDVDLFTMQVEASFAGLSTLTGLGAPSSVTASHIHCCTATAGTSTAGVATVTPSFTGFPTGVTSGTYDHTFDMSLASGWNGAFITANGGTTGTAFSALLAGLDSGKAYLNIHSNAFGGGEIRGFLQVSAVPEPGSYALLLAGLGVVGWVARRRVPA